ARISVCPRFVHARGAPRRPDGSRPAAGAGAQADGDRSMSKRGKHDSRKRIPFMMDGQWIARPLAMLESPAFRTLSLVEHRLLARLEIEHMHHAGKENGQLVVTYDQYAEWIKNRNHVAAALRACCALGFVEVTRWGKGGPSKTPNLYR